MATSEGLLRPLLDVRDRRERPPDPERVRGVGVVRKDYNDPKHRVRSERGRRRRQAVRRDEGREPRGRRRRARAAGRQLRVRRLRLPLLRSAL